MIATAVLAAQYAGTLDLSETTRIGARSSIPAPVVPLPTPGAFGTDYLAADLAASFTARLHVLDPHWDYALYYSPTLTAADVELGFVPQLLQTGGAAIGWHGRFLRVTLSESASYARISSALLFQQLTVQGQTLGPAPPITAGQTTTPGQTITPGQTTTPGQTPVGPTTQLQPTVAPAGIDFGSTSTIGSVSDRTGRRSSVSLAGGYLVSGGLNPPAKLIFPISYGPLAIGTVAYGLTPVDSLVVTASGQKTTTSGACPPPSTLLCVEDTPLAELRASLHDQLTGAMSLSVTGGVAGYVITTPLLKEAVIQPEGAVVLSDRFGAAGRSSWTLSTGLAPSVDIRTGLVSNRLQAFAALADLVVYKVMVVYTAGLVQSVPFPTTDPYPITALSGGIEARMPVDRQIIVSAGLQEVWQNQGSYGTLLLSFGYVSVTARAETLTF